MSLTPLLTVARERRPRAELAALVDMSSFANGANGAAVLTKASMVSPTHSDHTLQHTAAHHHGGIGRSGSAVSRLSHSHARRLARGCGC
jgi:hypothetical protein